MDCSTKSPFNSIHLLYLLLRFIITLHNCCGVISAHAAVIRSRSSSALVGRLLYTFSLTNPHRKKSRGVKSGDLAYYCGLSSDLENFPQATLSQSWHCGQESHLIERADQPLPQVVGHQEYPRIDYLENLKTFGCSNFLQKRMGQLFWCLICRTKRSPSVSIVAYC